MSLSAKREPEQLITENLDIWTAAIKNKASTGRGSNKKQELYGIKKLRELILELAVRGLLVPQDPNDEPASVLLEKIAVRKEQLVKDGKIKKQKKLPPISEDEKPFELPQGWTWARLEAISDINGGFAFKSSNYIEVGTRVIRISDFDEKGFKDDKIVRYEYSSDLSPYLLAEKNILMAMTGGTVGKSLLVSKLEEDMVVNQRVATIRVLSDLLPSFVHMTLQTATVQNVIKEAKNSTNDNISMSDIKGFFVALPPEKQINRIVAKVDELMALCDQLEQQTESSLNAHQTLVETLLKALLDAAQSREDASAFEQAWQRIADHFDVLFTTEHSIDQLKQTILQLAVMGKLVPQDPNDEPASVLLEKIAAEKERLVKEGKIKKQKKLPPISDEEKPFELPEGWEWVRFGQVLTYKQGLQIGTEGQFSEPKMGTVRYLRITDFRSDEDIRYIPDSSQDVYCIEADLLMIRYGGTAGEVVTGKEGIFHNNMFRIDFDQRQLTANYLSAYFSLVTTRDVLLGGSTSSTMPQISHKIMNVTRLPLPPLKEQERIVSKVDQFMALCDNFKARINESQTTQLHLADAMAEQALN